MKYCDKCRSSYPNEFNVCPIDNSALRVTSELIPGMTIRDKYLILDKVGEGGMGAVYRARHLAFNEIRALKVVHQSFAEDRAFIKRFKTEAIVARKLQHPNAVRIDDLDSTEDGRPFIVMELVEGGNLKALIAETGILSVSRALNIAAQAADALAAAHNLGIVHRDVKPDNILVTHSPLDGTDFVKVVDFGIAKVHEGAIDVGSGYTATRSGMIVGTPQYLSPEQAMGMHGDQIDGRADIYSLGIVLYMMLTGQLPFESDTPMGFLLHHVQTQPVAPHLIRPDLRIPAEVSAVLMKALEKDRTKRFASAQEMAQALRNIQQHSQETRRFTPQAMSVPAPASEAHYSLPLQMGRAPSYEPPVAQPAERPGAALSREAAQMRSDKPLPRKRHVGAWIATACVVVLGAIFAVIYLSSTKANSKPSGTVPIADTRAFSVVADADIQRDIEQNLTALKDSSIQVAVQNGRVTLLGRSRSKEDSLQAESLALQVNGVKVVRNEIQVEANNSPVAANSTKSSEQSVVSKPAPPKKQAVASEEQPKKIDRATVEGFISAGKQATENGDYDSAIASYQKALQEEPHNAKAQAGLDGAKKAKQTEQQLGTKP
jgi:eukaryotic-like serine/threonine-protein kinase